MRQMIFNCTGPPIIIKIKELLQPEGMVLVDKTALHLELIDYNQWAQLVQRQTDRGRDEGKTGVF